MTKTIMPFGKYRGEYLEDIPLNYLQWVYDNLELKVDLEDEIGELIADYDPRYDDYC